MTSDQERREQVERQLRFHLDSISGTKEVLIDKKKNYKIKLQISNGVFRSDAMTAAVNLARFLHENSQFYYRKDCLDMCSGAGLQGLVMQPDAKTVDFVDINPQAIEDARKNIDSYFAANKCRAFVSNLFENVIFDYDTIVCNYPFFNFSVENFAPDLKNSMLKGSMLSCQSHHKSSESNITPVLFYNASCRLRSGGRLIVPYWNFAGEDNSPLNHYRTNTGFKLEMHESIKNEEGLQSGQTEVFVFKK